MAVTSTEIELTSLKVREERLGQPGLDVGRAGGQG